MSGISSLAGFAIGFFLFMVILIIIKVRREKRNKAARRRWNTKAGKTLKIAQAGVYSDLAPLVDALQEKIERISIVGGDGSYIISDKSWMLREALKKWFKENINVEYILTDPEASALKAFKEIELKNKKNFKIIEAKSADLEGDAARLAKRFETEHPTIIRLANGDVALWLEGEHPSGSVHAYDVEFVPPSAGETNPERQKQIDDYVKEVDYLVENAA